MKRRLTTFTILATVLAIGCASEQDDGGEQVPGQISAGAGKDGAGTSARTSTPVCGFDGRAFAVQQGAGRYSDPGSGARDLADPVGENRAGTYHVTTTADVCVPGAASDSLSIAQRKLIGTFGCSSPYYFEDFNSTLAAPATEPANRSSCVLGVDRWRCWPDKANGYPQLCPYSPALLAYVKGLGKLTAASGQVSDLSAHFSGDPSLSFDASRIVPSPEQGAIPSTPPGYAWVLPWEDPHGCGMSGCMLGI